MINPDEKKQILDGLSVIDELFSNLEFLVFELDDKLRDGTAIPNMSEIVDALNRSISTLRLTIDYVSEGIPPGEIKNTLGFYRSWISYLNRTISITSDNERLVTVIFGIVFDVINDLYRSFKQFKTHVEESLTMSNTQSNNPNPPIPTKEL